MNAAPLFAELGAATNFSFLRGGSHPEELVATAASLGYAGLGIADRNSVAGVVRAHVAAREFGTAETGLKLVVGSRLVFADETPDTLAYPKDRAAWGRLTKLLSVGNLRAEKGDCILRLDDLPPFLEGLQLVVLPKSSRAAEEPERDLPVAALKPALHRLASLAPGRVWLGLTAPMKGQPRLRLRELMRLAAEAGVPPLATGDPLTHAPDRKPLQDVITCIRLGVTLDAAGRMLEINAERHLKPPAEMARLFRAAPGAVEETARFLEGLAFSLDELEMDYPHEAREGFATAQEALAAYALEGARERYPGAVPDKVLGNLEYELALIGERHYAPYFLTVHEIVRFARSKDILCQGRGSAANSTVCYCLGITEVDPTQSDLLFDRFISTNRHEPPDIDVDFEHERREVVMQFIYERYGRAHAGLAASVITYRARSSIREVGKVFGLSQDTVSALSGTIWGWSSGAVEETEVRRIGLDPSDGRLAAVLSMARELVGFPRHLSQHTGGFVITRTRLDEVVPISNAAMEDRTVVEWDKDDLDALKLLKVDVLALGMLSCLRRAFAFMEEHYGAKHTLAELQQKHDDRVYAMIQRADTLGTFQIESRAQMSMLPRLRPKEFYDLVIEVAIVRPGPIQGDMVHPYLRRREGKEKVEYPSPGPEHDQKELEGVLGKTLGVPLFQEQAMRIAMTAAGFTPAEADQLRRAMATFRRVGTISLLRDKMVDGMLSRGYQREFAERCFSQIEGFGTYGFPESHAASFALLVYVSCWIKCRYPDVFAAALLNAQPMGFYAPAQIVRDAIDHGVEVRPVDINHSSWDASLEQGSGVTKIHPRHAEMAGDILGHHALRLGLRQISGFSEEDAGIVAKKREAGYDSVRDLWLRTGLAPAVLERLAEADAFRSIGLDRREALWAVTALRRSGDKEDLPLLALAAGMELEPDAHLPAMPLGQQVVEDYRKLSLSLKAHPVSFVRPGLTRRSVSTSAALATMRPGRRVTTAGLVLVRQRPGSAKGVIFITLEDETGVANIIVWPQVFERFRPLVLGSRFCAVTGKLQNEKGVIHIVADRIEDFTPMLGRLTEAATAPGAAIGRAGLAPADHVLHPLPTVAENIGARKAAARAKALLEENPAIARDLEILAADVTALARADEVRRPQGDQRIRDHRVRDHRPRTPAQTPLEPEPVRAVLPKGRNFH